MAWDETKRPRSVVCAVILLWAWLTIGLVGGIVNATKVIDENPTARSVHPEIYTVVGLGFMVAVSSLLILQISAGRNWARIALAVWDVAGFLFVRRAEWVQSIEILQSGITLLAIVLLFLPASNEWYRRMRTIRLTGGPQKVGAALGVRTRVILAMIGCPLLFLVSFAMRREVVVASPLSMVAIWLASQIAWAKCPSCGTRIGNAFQWPAKHCWNCRERL